MTAIKKAAVIGAGTMGSAIAAHIANAGVPVVLLDVVPPGANDRSTLAKTALAKLAKVKPAAFMERRASALITPGNIEDDMARLADADWILEAVVEDLAVKRGLFTRIQEARRPGSIVSSNTSTIPLRRLVHGMPEDFARDFMITHFFNPPRYLRLIEFVKGEKTRADAVETLRKFSDERLGKTVIDCHDTPGFVANRIGVFWLQTSMRAAMDLGVSVEDADAIISAIFSTPRTGVFGLVDLVGLELIPYIGKSLAATLAPEDPCRAVLDVPGVIKRMISEGRTGRNRGAGFYRVRDEGGRKVREVVDLATGDYRPARGASVAGLRGAEGELRSFLGRTDVGGRYAWRVMSATLSYAAMLIPEVADDIVAVDQAMRFGYGWQAGPFEIIDKLGAAWFAERLKAEHRDVPALLRSNDPFYRTENGSRTQRTHRGHLRIVEPEGVLRLANVKIRTRAVLSNSSASVWDIGDGIACLEFHSKMNTFDRKTLSLIRKTVDYIPTNFRGLVIGNDAENFSAGVNLGLALFAANVAAWPAIEAMLKEGQDAFRAIKYAPFPVVGAPSGLALGGGCEVLLHCDAIQAHAETYMGLVEVGAGIVPGWGGCKELLARWFARKDRPQGPMPAIAQTFETIALAKVSTSAPEARELLYLGPNDAITMNRDRVLADAKAKAIALGANYRPPAPPTFVLPGPTAATALSLAVDDLVKSGKATPYDRVVALALAEVLSGGDTDITETVTEETLLALERRAALSLIRNPQTLARIEHLLETGKPLRN
jgi:3-hydroxyacyl-CoA dehydrogenase